MAVTQTSHRRRPHPHRRAHARIGLLRLRLVSSGRRPYLIGASTALLTSLTHAATTLWTRNLLRQPNAWHKGTSPMIIIDSQVHAYEANTPKRPWQSVRNWPDHVTGDEMVAAMDKVGVHGAIFISAFSLYRYDASYAVEVQRAHRGRFAIVKPVDPDDPAIGDLIADWKQTPGAVGIRIIMTKEAKREPNDPGLDRILRAAVKHDLPVNIL